jgi:hypothetical protein
MTGLEVVFASPDCTPAADLRGFVEETFSKIL